MSRGKLSSTTHVLIGAGKMGGALLDGWLAETGETALSPGEILVIDPSPGEAAKKALGHGVKFSSNLTKGAASGTKLCLLAVKPQSFDAVHQDLVEALPKDALIVSIMAGINLHTLGEVFAPRPVIRAMPNTPAAIGKGITAFVCSETVNAAQKSMARARLEAGGKVVELTEERQIDMVTALSGSGPAYVFHLTETMAAAGVNLGLPEELARLLARETVIGSGAMLEQTDAHASDLRKAVTSPRGTTEAALEVLMGHPGLSDLMRAAISAAFHRSRELGEN
ncbi:MAG TPA: pyrroline-5-carboxylate reductase [Hellea balneolensis]|uniref:Pyrroline-5-carboxylate reductase n=1 Tax=Hellea balneolensis TaxID=287478 RepID=A0A7C5R1P6_9PROT|nr:pyrroline-5-carboxylate reductase [Hellea balneolensis]